MTFTRITTLCAAAFAFAVAAEPTTPPAPRRHALAPGTPMHFSMGNDVSIQQMTRDEASAIVAERAVKGKAAGITAFEPYVKWMLCEPQEGTWDFSFYDMQVEAYRAQGIRWIPFLIAGPAYATPAWFKDGKESVFARCLEHGKDSRIQSIWNPQLPARTEAFLAAFAKHYDHANIEAALLGVSGDYGEAIYPVLGNKWTWLFDGEYHGHRGWWCGDQHAVQAFRQAMRQRYTDIAALNQAWGTTHADFAAVRPFVPDPKKQSRQQRLDMSCWYTDSMTAWGERWIQWTRKHLPDTTILLCTGGEAEPATGADFSAQAIMAERYQAGLRITNEDSDYAKNFVKTRWVGTACRQLGTYFGYEPAGKVTDEGIAVRIYNAIASGADELFVYDNPPEGERGAVYARYKSLMTKRVPQVPVAVLVSKTAQHLGEWGDTYRLAAELRDWTDFDMIDEALIARGCLQQYQAVLWLDGRVTDRATLEALETWAKGGGLLASRVTAEAIDGTAWAPRLAALPGAIAGNPKGKLAEFCTQIVAARPALFPDGKADRVFWTTFTDGKRLILNQANKPITIASMTIAAGTIAELAP